MFLWGFPGGSGGKESTCMAGDLGSIPGLGRSPGEGSGNSLQYSCLGNSIGRDAWRGHWVTMSQTQLRDYVQHSTVYNNIFVNLKVCLAIGFLKLFKLLPCG